MGHNLHKIPRLLWDNRPKLSTCVPIDTVIPCRRGAINRLGTARFRQNEFDDGHGISRLFYTPDGRNVVTVGSEHAVTNWDCAWVEP